MTQPTTVDIFSPTFKANPYPTYVSLRDNQPICRIITPEGQPLWLITRYEDCLAVLKDDRFVKNVRAMLTPEQAAQFPPMPEALKPLSANMLDMDGASHDRLRSLVHKAFTPRLIEKMQGRIQTIADTLLDKAQARGEMEFMTDFAFPLPITVIGEMLGIPSDVYQQFREWTNALLNTGLTENVEHLLPVVQAFIDYLRELFEQRRQQPADDLISALIRAEESGDTLSEDELLAMVFILIVAGHETTVNLIGNGTLALLQNPDQLALLRRDPSLIKSAMEELLRFCGPLETATERYASTDIAIGGEIIPQGEMVLVGLASANRDPRQFENPEVLDITRQNNRHIAFGQGVHYCVGAPLARLETQIAFTTLLRRLPNLALNADSEAIAWRPSFVIRGLERLPVKF
ncbi:MAG: cytochrome P450 [Anaerolineae bacterium]|nr:cytochrome P450 [Anaerolineae bacterium]